jgi:hypothetical protein
MANRHDPLPALESIFRIAPRRRDPPSESRAFLHFHFLLVDPGMRFVTIFNAQQGGFVVHRLINVIDGARRSPLFVFES